MYLKIMCILFLLAPHFVFSNSPGTDDAKRHSGINVTMMSADGPFTENEWALLDKFKNYFQKAGLHNPDTPMYEILLTQEALNDSQTIVTVLLMQTASNRLIELAKKDQLFYKLISPKDKQTAKKVNNEIREYVSGEYIKQYRQILDSNIFIIANDNLEEEVDRISSLILKKPYLAYLEKN
jgi:hypothetical protein